MKQDELDAIKTRAQLARWRLRKADETEFYEQRVMIGLTFINAHPRADDDMFALLAEVERLRTALTNNGYCPNCEYDFEDCSCGDVPNKPIDTVDAS